GRRWHRRTRAAPRTTTTLVRSPPPPRPTRGRWATTTPAPAPGLLPCTGTGPPGRRRPPRTLVDLRSTTPSPRWPPARPATCGWSATTTTAARTRPWHSTVADGAVLAG